MLFRSCEGDSAFTGIKAPGTPALVVVLSSTPTEVSCAHGEATANAEPTGTTVLVMKLVITVSECIVTSDEADCEVAGGGVKTEPIEGTTSGLIEVEEGGNKVLRLGALGKPESPATSFATVTIKSKSGHTCLAATTNGKIKGAEQCYFVEVIEEDAVAHLLKCTEQGSSLTFAGTPIDMEFTGEMKLAAPHLGESWSAVEGT